MKKTDSIAFGSSFSLQPSAFSSSSIQTAPNAKHPPSTIAAVQNTSFCHDNGCGLLQTTTKARAASRISAPKRYQTGTIGFRVDAASGCLAGAVGCPRISERTPGPAGAVSGAKGSSAFFAPPSRSASKFRPKTCFVMPPSVDKEPPGNKPYFSGREKVFQQCCPMWFNGLKTRRIYG